VHKHLLVRNFNAYARVIAALDCEFDVNPAVMPTLEEVAEIFVNYAHKKPASRRDSFKSAQHSGSVDLRVQLTLQIKLVHRLQRDRLDLRSITRSKERDRSIYTT
jgi:hypothetical protein